MIMLKGVASGFIITPPRDFEVPSEWYYDTELERRVWRNFIWYNVCTSYKFPSSHSEVMNGLASSLKWVDFVELGEVRLVRFGYGRACTENHTYWRPCILRVERLEPVLVEVHWFSIITHCL
jgi:hypothetical protein